MPRHFRLLAAVVLALLTFSVSALDLQQAKTAGLVGEQRNGYIGAVAAKPSPEVKALIKSVNAARRDRYQGIAAKNKLQLKQVEALAADKAIKKTRRGHFVQAANGKWVKK